MKSTPLADNNCAAACVMMTRKEDSYRCNQADKNLQGHVFRKEFELNITFFFLGELSEDETEIREQK